MQRKIFAKQLKMLIRKSGLRQIEVAEMIGVSSAAISQFVHGTTLPSQRHILAIFDALKVPAKSRSQLQYQLMLARSEPRNTSRISAMSLFHLRSKRGLTIAQVEARSAIPQERLLELEQNENASITPEEKEILSNLYGIDWNNSSGSVNVSEPEVPEYSAIGAPQIMVSDLIEYDRQEPINKFAWSHIRNFLPRPINDVTDPVVAQAFSSEVGFKHDGLLLIVLTENPPTGYAPMELRFYEGNVFRLWQPDDTPVRDDVPSFENNGRLLWSIPVAEVVLQPLKVKSR